MSRLGAGPGTQLFCMGPSAPAGPGEWGGWGQRGSLALWEGVSAAGRHPAMQAPRHVGSRAGRVTHGGSEEAHRWEKRPSTATLGTGNPQQCEELLLGTGEREITAPWAVCEQKPVPGFEMVPSECCNTSNKHSWLPHFASPAPRNVLSPNFSSRMGSSAPPQHAEPKGPPQGHRRDPPHPTAGAKKREPQGLGSHNSWWQMVGHCRQPAPAAAAKACLVKGHQARGWTAPRRLPGDRLHELCRRKGQCLGVSLRRAAASSWHPPAWPAAP